MIDETNEPRPRIENERCPECRKELRHGPAGDLFGVRDYCGMTNGISCFVRQHRLWAAEIERLRGELAENAAMHWTLGLAGFDEDISFAEAVKLLLAEFQKAKRELAEAKEMETLAIDMADDLTHRLTLEGDKLSKAKQELAEMCNVFRCELCGRDIDPACPHCWEEKLATARADALEEAAKAVETWQLPITGQDNLAAAIRRLAAHDPNEAACEKGLEDMGFEKKEPCETCGGQTWPDYTQGCSDCKPDKKEM